jgi:hypothetical protein
MTRTRLAACAGGALMALGVLGYLRDPPWAGQITSGLHGWDQDRRGGELYRWTYGRASFFVPSEVTMMTLPLRAGFPGRDGGPMIVSVWVDDRWLADIELPDAEEWVRASLPLPRKATSRRFRRVDLHVSRTYVGDTFIVGVQTGEIVLD